MMGEIDEEEPMSMLDDEESEEAVMEKMDHESTEHGHTSNLMLRNGHISLFGEIIHDTEAMISDDLIPPPVRDSNEGNVSKNSNPFYLRGNKSSNKILLNVLK